MRSLPFGWALTAKTTQGDRLFWQIYHLDDSRMTPLHAGRYKIHLVRQPSLPVLWGTLVVLVLHAYAFCFWEKNGASALGALLF